MQYYFTLKTNEILTQASTWVNLEDVMLNEISPSQKDKYCLIPFIEGTQNRWIIETERRVLVARRKWGVIV